MITRRTLTRLGLLALVAASLGGCCIAPPWGYGHGHHRDYGYVDGDRGGRSH